MSALGTPVKRPLTGWGRTSPTVATTLRPTDVEQVAAAVRGRDARGILARGMGRSYGDAAQNAGGLVLDLTALDRVGAVDGGAATVQVEAGVTVEALTQALMPSGWWLPVVPGTGKVTVGGAIAADVHGKNHHMVGSFGCHVRDLDLVTADGSLRTLAPGDPVTGPLFWATVGGMGLTGVVVRATLRLQRVPSSFFLVDTERAHHLDELMERLAAGDDAYPYSVAWFDATTTGSRLGRAVITRGRSATPDELDTRLRRTPYAVRRPSRGTVPPGLPGGLLNRVSARAFNELWFRKAPAWRRDVQDVATFFHPLDGVQEWNRLYGPRGLCQYQLVVPDSAGDALRAAVGTIAGSGHVSALNVLKRFGPGNASPLSFPMAGWTLAVDLPVRPGLGSLLRRLDSMVVEAGGRAYLAKDSRLPSATVAAMYPRLEEFLTVRAEADPEGAFRSDLARRLGLDAVVGR